VVNENGSPAFCQVTKSGKFIRRFVFISKEGVFSITNDIYRAYLSIPVAKTLMYEQNHGSIKSLLTECTKENEND